MDRDKIISIIKNGKSPTQRFLLEYFPEGSTVSKVGIMNIYEKKSESQRRNPRTAKSSGCRYSVRKTRRHSGSRFFTRMVNLGYWKSIQDTVSH